MCERRYGRVIMLQSSDAEISGAIARGMLEAWGDDTSSGAPRHLPLYAPAALPKAAAGSAARILRIQGGNPVDCRSGQRPDCRRLKSKI